MKQNTGVAGVNLEIFEFFGIQTIEGSRKFQSLPLFWVEENADFSKFISINT
jgi:hypothetical protein